MFFRNRIQSRFQTGNTDQIPDLNPVKNRVKTGFKLDFKIVLKLAIKPDYRVIIHSVSIFLKKNFYVFKCKWGDFSYTCSSEYDISFAADFSQKSQITAEKNYFYEIQVFRNWSIIVANFDQIWLFQNKCFANFIDFTSCLNEY